MLQHAAAFVEEWLVFLLLCFVLEFSEMCEEIIEKVFRRFSEKAGGV